MLKALELTGFKSFADKTRLDFHAGVTCVVGPNGSGKSNVVDAIKWVTGSQSAKAMRGKEMTDVIFNGASERRAMNYAEVTLEFDNNSSLFDISAPLVRFTRRVYRSGEGEYLLNNSPSRLRDIRALLAGTGIGAESYSVIEQGRVDALLRASPKDRRAIFEEAAGVSRFRLKKHEAEKRLARVEQNLLRLSDIVDEVEGRLRRVKKQAGKAQRYRESTERLRLLRTQLGLVDWNALNQRAERIERRTATLKAEQEQGAQTLELAEEELDRLASEEEQAAGKLAHVNSRTSNLRESIGAGRARNEADYSRIAELEGELRHKHNRVLGALVRKPQGDRSEAHLRAQLDAATDQRRRALEELDQTQQRSEAAEQEWTHLKSKAESLDQAVHAAINEYDSLKRAESRQEDTLSKQLSEHQENLERSKRVGAEVERLDQEIAHSRGLEQSTAEELDKVSRSLSAHQDKTAALRSELDGRRKRLAESRTQSVELRHQIESAEMLETDLEELRDLFPESGSSGWRVQGVVADLLHVDFDSAPMVEAALGARARHLVLDSGRLLLADLGRGGTAPSTRVSLQRLDHQGAASVVDRIDLTGQPGVMGRADQFVECEPVYEPLVRRLLGRVWFVDTLETAERLASGAGKGLGFVTYQGEALSADGVLTIGPRQATQSLFTRRTRLEEQKSELAEATRLTHTLEEQIAALERAIAEEESSDKNKLEHRNRATDANAEARHKTRRLKEQWSTLQEEQHALEATLAAADQLLAGSRTNLAATRQRVAAIDESVSAAREERGELATLQQDLDQRLRPLQAAVVEKQVALAKAEQNAEVLSAQQRQTQHSRAERGTERKEAVQEVADCRSRIAAIELRLLAARSELDSLHLELDTMLSEQRALLQTTSTIKARRAQIAQAVKQRRGLVDRVGAERQQLEIQLTEVRHEQTGLADRLRDDYGIQLDAVAGSEQGETVGDRAAVEQEIAVLREDVHSVGAVNLESIEELDDLETRFQQLSSQYQDLSEAKNSLEKLLQRLNIETRKMFLATIESVRGEFRELFRQLFGGGESDLVLVDGEREDPLDAGVEIRAQPPGKDLSNITLLSGGEKTLTCVALLLALFRTNPSPFCVLDEVDAALDEANIDRFTGVLSEFLSSTQFIVVTHSKKTMTDADTIYGITMQESGVSKQVAVRFEEVDEQGYVRPAASQEEQQGKAA